MAREEAALAVTLRPLTVADAPEFFALRFSALTEAPRAFGQEPDEYAQWPLERVQERIRPEPGMRLALGAFVASRMVAFAVLARVDARARVRHRAELTSVYAAPQVRGQGVMETLLRALIREARRWPDVQQIELVVTLPQGAAHRLYERLGFRVWGVQPRAMMIRGEAVDEEHMVLELDAPTSQH